MRFRFLLLPLVLAYVACGDTPLSQGAVSPHYTISAVSIAGDSVLYPPLPDSIISKKGWTKVNRTDPPLICGDTTYIYWGCFTYDSRKLEVVKGLSPYDAWKTLYHEETHMILGDAKIAEKLTEKQNEAIADAVADVRMLQRLTRKHQRE